MSEKLVIIMPAYNEERVIRDVICNLQEYLNNPEMKILNPEIVVVDDGSKDQTLKIAANTGVIGVRHIINCGLGAALGTGFQLAIQRGATVAVTFDSDGQHDPHDIPNMIAPILKNEADVVIGSRLIHHAGMPRDRVIINKVANFVTWVLFGVKSTDSQSGYRAFNRKALEMIEIKTSRMEVSSEILSEVKHNRLRFIETPITVIYTEYSRKKGQQNANSLSVLMKLILRRMR